MEEPMSEDNVEDRLRELESRIAALEAVLKRDLVSTNRDGSAVARVTEEVLNDDRSIVQLSLQSKRYVPGEFGDDRIDMDFTLKLAEGVGPTRAIKGQLLFTDLFGDPQFAVGYTVNDSMVPYEALAPKGVGFDYNQFMSEHKWMLVTDVHDMHCSFKVSSIIFQDGTTKSF
jgi:hypothetical protein